MNDGAAQVYPLLKDSPIYGNLYGNLEKDMSGEVSDIRNYRFLTTPVLTTMEREVQTKNCTPNLQNAKATTMLS